jgi:DNA-directed RNA polymerase specialized sigma24 family protein
MTPQRRSDFEREWPELARRLEFFLVRSGVNGDTRDDVIQDTALRLYGMWMRVETDRSAWPLTKTIALNLVRDAARRRGTVEIAAEIPDLPAPHDVESSGIARLELRRIQKALDEMSPAHRALLLEEVGGDASEVATSPAAEKMMRMRARKRLIALLEKVSALIPGRHSGFLEWASGLVTARDGLAGGLACLLCVFLGTGIVIVGPGSSAPAKARPPRAAAVPALDASTISTRHGFTPGIDSNVRDAYEFTSAARRKAGSTTLAGGSKSGGTDAAGEAGTQPEPLPIPEEVPGTGLYVDPDDVGVAPETPEPPQTKTGLEGTVDEVVETTTELLDDIDSPL